VKNNDYEYFTYEIDRGGSIDVYGWGRYTEPHVLAGHPRKMFLKTGSDLREIMTAFTGIYDTHPAFE